MPRSIFGYLEGDAGRRSRRLSRGVAKHEDWTEAILPADAEAPSPEGETDRRPLAVFAAVICVALMALTVRLFVLQIVDGGHNLLLAEGNRIHTRVARAPRGLIYDRTGQLLAQNKASYDVTVVPQLLPRDAAERQVVYARLSSLTGMPAAEIAAKAESVCRGQDPVKTGCLASPIPQLVQPGLPRETALLVEQTSAVLRGFALDVNPIREYPDASLFSLFLGYTGRVSAEDVTANAGKGYGPTDLIGKLGLEKQYEEVLRGRNGGERIEVDATSKPLRVLENVEPVPGSNLVLALDQRLQRKLTEAIARQMTASGAKRASGVAMDPRTGEVLAAVSLPSYDNNLFSRGISQRDYQALVNDAGQPLFNKVANGAYPSGSIIKPFGAAAALQEGIINTTTTVNDTGRMVVPNPYDPSKPSIYLGWERTTGLGIVNVFTAIARSSDIFFYKVMGGLKGAGAEDFLRPLGVNKLTDYYKKFGLGSKTGIDLPAEAAGRVPTPDWKKKFSGEIWYTGDTYNISVGQGDMLVSPLQMVSALSVLANGGTLYKPHLLTQITDIAGKVVQKIKPEVIRKNFISAANIQIVRQGMWQAVNASLGTACCRIREEVPVVVAAKTGTAETVAHDTGVDARLQSRPHAWFEAFAPFDDPRIAIVVLIEHSGEGSQFAAPAVRETLAWYFTQGAGANR